MGVLRDKTDAHICWTPTGPIRELVGAGVFGEMQKRAHTPLMRDGSAQARFQA